MLSQEHLYHFHTGRRRQSNLPDPLGPLARVSPRSSPGSWHCRSRKDSGVSERRHARRGRFDRSRAQSQKPERRRPLQHGLAVQERAAAQVDAVELDEIEAIEHRALGTVPSS